MRFWKQILENFRNEFEKLSGRYRSGFLAGCQLIFLSKAIGFAFQNILQNFLARILLLLQESFRMGDWTTITGFEGKVEDIQTRAAAISTSEDQRIVIPNAVLFTNPVVVGHAAPKKEEPNFAEAGLSRR